MTGNSLFAVVLAAGESRRFGTPKQLAEYDGRPLVERAVRLAESVCGERTLLVLGSEWQRVSAACAPLEGFLTINGKFADGIGTSIACASRCLQEIADGLIILLADQPLVTTSHLQQLVEVWRAAPESVVASAYANTYGPPVIFPRSAFPVLTRLRGDAGASKLIGDREETAVFVPFEPAAKDIDYPEDLTGSR